MTGKRKIKKHPGIDFSHESLVLKNAYINQLEKIRDALSTPANALQKIAEEFKKASQPSREFKNALLKLNRMSYPNKFREALEEAKEIQKVSKEHGKK